MLNWRIKTFSPLVDLKVNGYTCKREKGQNLRPAGEPSQHWILFGQAISKPCGHLKRTRVFGRKKKESFANDPEVCQWRPATGKRPKEGCLLLRQFTHQLLFESTQLCLKIYGPLFFWNKWVKDQAECFSTHKCHKCNPKNITGVPARAQAPAQMCMVLKSFLGTPATNCFPTSRTIWKCFNTETRGFLMEMLTDPSL